MSDAATNAFAIDTEGDYLRHDICGCDFSTRKRWLTRSCETKFGGQVVCGNQVNGTALEQYEAGLKKRAEEIRAEATETTRWPLRAFRSGPLFPATTGRTARRTGRRGSRHCS
jgi:hypothetical protein